MVVGARQEGDGEGGRTCVRWALAAASERGGVREQPAAAQGGCESKEEIKGLTVCVLHWALVLQVREGG